MNANTANEQSEEKKEQQKNEVKGTNILSKEFEIMDNVLIIHVNGELDHHNAIMIREKADEIICKKGIVNIMFDFERTDFMDSSGIGVIMGRYKKVKDFGGTVGVVNVRKNVEKILLFSGLNKIVKYYDNIEMAVTAMKGGN